MSHTHVHRRLADDTARTILSAYDRKELTRAAAQAQLGIERSRFFTLLSAYRADPKSFSIAYERASSSRISAKAERRIREKLEKEKQLTIS